MDIIHDCLTGVLEDNLNEFDEMAVERIILPRFERHGVETVRENEDEYHLMLFGFGLDFPEETASLRTVVDDFIDAMQTDPTVHLVKFEDPLLKEELSRWAGEIYTLEMRLRRALSLVYLHANKGGDLYQLLDEEIVQPMNKVKSEEMMPRAENQFFHMTFSNYVGLNQRKKPNNISDLLNMIRNEATYEEFRNELFRSPVNEEDDAIFLAGLKERMEPIESMRNCCAHFRKPSKKVVENYEIARPLVNKHLDEYLARWEPDEEFSWEKDARNSVAMALEGANWDEEECSINLYDAQDERINETVFSREELYDYLCELARNQYFANAPRLDGDYPFKFDENGMVEDALAEYEDRLEEFFGGEADN